MIRLYDTGAYLLNGTELIEDNADAAARLHQALGAQVPSKEEAAKNTIAYSILRDHNTSGNMEKLKAAFLYGADAVYCAGKIYRTRKSARIPHASMLKRIGTARRFSKRRKSGIVIPSFSALSYRIVL